jgi:putative FmdB family regulatory protein
MTHAGPHVVEHPPFDTRRCLWLVFEVSTADGCWRNIVPIYEYMCNHCRQPFEELVLSASAVVVCPLCNGKKIKRLMSVVNSRSRGGGAAPMAAGSSCGGCTRTSCGGCSGS